MQPSDTKMDRVLYFARWIRRTHRKPYEIPIREMIVVHPDAEFLQYVDGQYREFLLEEVNVGSLKTSKDILKYAHYRAVPFTPLIERLGESLAADLVKSMSQDDILSYLKSGEITIASHRLTKKEILVKVSFKLPDGLTEDEMAGVGLGGVYVVLDLRPDESLMEDDIVAREVVWRIKQLRKRTRLEPTEVYFECLDENDKSLEQVLSSQESYIQKAIGCPLLPCSLMPSDAVMLPGCEVKFTTLANNKSISIKLTRRPTAAGAFKLENEARSELTPSAVTRRAHWWWWCCCCF